MKVFHGLWFILTYFLFIYICIHIFIYPTVLTLNTPWFFVKLILLSAVLVIFCLGLVRLVINNSFDHPWNGGGVEGLGSGGGGGGVRDWLSGRSSTAGSLLPMTMADSSAQSRDRFNKFSGYR